MQFLEHYVTFEQPELKEKLSQEIHQTKEAMGIEEIIIDHYRQEGIAEGEKVGIEKGLRLSIQKMLVNGFQPEFIAKALSIELKIVLEVQHTMKNGGAQQN